VTVNPEITVEIRPLEATDTRRSLRAHKLPRIAVGVLTGVQGTRLIIRVEPFYQLPQGTLVFVETSLRVYLGEIKHRHRHHLFIDVDHELDKAELEAIRQAWL
jgi:hypothetical protein